MLRAFKVLLILAILCGVICGHKPTNQDSKALHSATALSKSREEKINIIKRPRKYSKTFTEYVAELSRDLEKYHESHMNNLKKAQRKANHEKEVTKKLKSTTFTEFVQELKKTQLFKQSTTVKAAIKFKDNIKKPVKFLSVKKTSKIYNIKTKNQKSASPKPKSKSTSPILKKVPKNFIHNQIKQTNQMKKKEPQSKFVNKGNLKTPTQNQNPKNSPKTSGQTLQRNNLINQTNNIKKPLIQTSKSIQHAKQKKVFNHQKLKAPETFKQNVLKNTKKRAEIVKKINITKAIQNIRKNPQVPKPVHAQTLKAPLNKHVNKNKNSIVRDKSNKSNAQMNHKSKQSVLKVKKTAKPQKKIIQHIYENPKKTKHVNERSAVKQLAKQNKNSRSQNEIVRDKWKKTNPKLQQKH